MRIVFYLFIIGFCFVANNINANAEEVPVVQEEWNPPSAGPITTWTAGLCGKGKFQAQPFFFYNMTRGQFDSKGDYKALPDGDKQYQYQEQILLKYGFTDKLELAAQTIYQQNYIKQGDLKAHDAGLGDSLLLLRYCTCNEKEKGWLPDIDGMFQLKIPTGKYQHLDPNKLGVDLNGATSSPGAWAPGIGIDMTKKLKPFILHFDYIYSFPQQVRVDGVNTDYANFINSDFAVEYFLTKGFSLMLEANTFWQGDKYQDGARQPSTGVRYVTVSPGIGWANDKIQTLIAYQRVVLGKNTAANDSLVLTCVYTF